MSMIIMESTMWGTSLISSPSIATSNAVPQRLFVSAGIRSKNSWKPTPSKTDEAKKTTVARPFKSVNLTAARMIARLEKKARTSATAAAERALLEEAPLKPDADAAILQQQRGRMNGWWADHLATLASTTEMLVNPEESKAEVSDIQIPQAKSSYVGMGSREADADETRAALREFYYPRSNPGSYF